MKLNLKKLAAVALSALEILTAMPSAFCAPKPFPNSAEKKYETTAPRKRTNNAKSSKKEIIINSIISKQLIGRTFNKKCIEAPNAITVGDYGLANQPNVKKIKLPQVTHVGSHAFENCENLEKIVFTDQLAEIAPDAFVGCRIDLKIIYKGEEFTADELMRKIKPYVKVDTNFGFYHTSDYRYYGKDKINMIIQPVDEKVDNSSSEESSSFNDTLTVSEISR